MKKSTTNYKQFSVHGCNRVYDISAYKKLLRSIASKNLLEFEPIKVDKDFCVIDGKHRLKAAEELRIPIWYEVNEQSSDEDFLLYNTAKRTVTLEDYLEFFIYKGNVHYIKFKQFANDNNLLYRTALLTIDGKDRGKIYARFKAGEFQFPKDDILADLIEKIDAVGEILDLLRQKLPNSSQLSWLRSGRIKDSLLYIISIPEVDAQTFVKKIGFQIDKIHPCANINQFIDLWKRIYNWRNAQPLKSIYEENE